MYHNTCIFLNRIRVTDPQIQSPYIEEYLKQTAAIQVLHVYVLSYIRNINIIITI